MDVRALLFGSKLRTAATVVFGLGLAVGGAFLAGILGVPSVERVDNRFGAVNETDTEIRTDLVVHNPNPVGARLGSLGVNYSVSMNDVRVATGEKQGLGLGTGNSTIALTTHLKNERIPDWWVTHIRNGEQTDMTIDATVKSGLLGQSATFQPASRSIDTNLIGQFNSSERRPVNADMALVEDPVLVVRQTNASWGEVTSAETPINLEFGVYNPKSTPVVISNIGYNITMNDVQVGSGETEETESIPGKTYRVVETPTAIQNERLDDWWVSHVRNDQVTELRIDFYAEVQPPGSEETIRVPLDDMTYTKTIETDLFGTKDAAASDESDTGGESDSSSSDTTTAADGDTTTTSDDTTTTTTEDSTTSDDGSTTTEDDGLLDRGRVSTP
ncbi:LEA type 2 family protein [Halobacterium litoreum]|uniref:LEA type 2 family protein n=1 Tax=Halobacterium litoreum TaxID=2039234 RepID=A0ABD5NJA2_9EURY|nr:LEA type 2 family protein [Halobacterium litoreum]UHH12192.1 LEA type 2 family protein [Halobacterium litoreum]